MMLSGNEFAKRSGGEFGNSLMVCALATFESGHHSVNKRANFAIIQQCAVTILIGLVGSEDLLSNFNDWRLCENYTSREGAKPQTLPQHR